MRVLHDSWTQFTWRVASYVVAAGRCVTWVRSTAQAHHARAVQLVLQGAAVHPALQNLLRSEQLVSLLLMYCYSAGLALAVAALLQVAAGIQRGQRELRRRRQHAAAAMPHSQAQRGVRVDTPQAAGAPAAVAAQ